MGFATAPLFGDHGNDLIVGNALIWAALIGALTYAFQGTVHSQLVPILIGGAGASVLYVAWGVRRFQSKSDR